MGGNSWQWHAIPRAAQKAQQCGWIYHHGQITKRWINTKLKGRKQFKKVYTFVTTSLTLIQAQCLIKPIQVQWGSPSADRSSRSEVFCKKKCF